MAIINFTVNYDLLASDTDSSDQGVDADVIPLIGSVLFEPVTADDRAVLAPAYSPRPAGFKLRSFTGFIDVDGRLKAARSGAVGVRLWANDPVLELERLTYKVTFNLTTPVGESVRVDGGYFEAPETDSSINLANVLQSSGLPSPSVVQQQLVYANEIVDSTATGQALMIAANAGAARTAIGATATGSSLITAASAAAARTAINADFMVSAKDYGAVGNGTTDDTTALQNWLNYLVTNHQQGWLPNGTYKITATLVAQPGYGWGITGESSNYTQIKQFTNNIAILQLGTTSGSSHSIFLDNILFIYNTAQSSANTGANCLDFRCETAGNGNFYWSQFTRLQFWKGYYGIKFLSNSYTPWGCVWDQLYMDTMSGGLLDQSGGLSSAANNRWGRVTMRCAGAVGPIFKEWGMYNSTVDCLEFVDADQGPQLITTGNAFSADIGSIKLEIGTYTGAGKALINFIGDYRVRLGSIQIGPGTFTPSSGILSVITVGAGAVSDASFIDINTAFLAAGSGSVSGQAVFINGGGLPSRRININAIELDDGWTLQSTGSSTTGDFVTVRSWVNGALSDSQGDTNYTVTLGHPNAVHFNTAFTAQRTITLPASSSNNNVAGLYYDLIFDGAINGSNTALIKHGSTTLRTQSVDKKRLRYAWRRGGSGTGLWVLVDVADIDTPAVFLGSADSNILSQSLRANRAITGGGTITVDASSYVLWSTRFITVSNGRGSTFCPDGFWSIECPVSGTITGVGGASNKTATAAGIPLDAYESLYYILPLTSGQSSLAANFRVVGYTSTLEVPHNWVLICTRNGNNSVFSFNNGINLRAGESLNSIHQDTANTANTLVRRNASGNFSAGTITAALSGNATTSTTATFCTSGIPDNTATTMNARVIRNGNTTTTQDGMYIGYGNTGSGVTRIYGGGETTNSVDVGSGGNLTVAGRLSVSGTTATIRAGTGTPESVVTANVGSIYLRTDGGAGTTLYIKESGAGNTGWVAK